MTRGWFRHSGFLQSGMDSHRLSKYPKTVSPVMPYQSNGFIGYEVVVVKACQVRAKLVQACPVSSGVLIQHR